jgi:hypothetical protein
MRASSGVKQNDLFYYQKEMEMLGNSKENKLRVCIIQKGSEYDNTVYRTSVYEFFSPRAVKRSHTWSACGKVWRPLL